MLSIDELEVRGYVRRVADPADARAKLVRLTAKGRRCATECRRAVQSLDTRTTPGWEPVGTRRSVVAGDAGRGHVPDDRALGPRL